MAVKNKMPKSDVFRHSIISRKLMLLVAAGLGINNSNGCLIILRTVLSAVIYEWARLPRVAQLSVKFCG